MTAFVHERVELLPGLSVVIDGNSKITAGNGTYAAPAPNAFSLPAASVSAPGYCPKSTPTCRASCYVRGLAKNAPDVYRAYTENAEALSSIVGVHEDVKLRGKETLSAIALGEWISAHCKGGFRWHVSGDVWHRAHARWIVMVCAASEDVRHWIYTRTLSAVPLLRLAPNLAVNVSADRDNWERAFEVARANGARVCYMATSEHLPAQLTDDDVVFPDYPLRGRELERPTAHDFWQSMPHRLRVITCPADFFGQSESSRCGPCAKCIVHPKSG